jgi:hypothetical protein
MAEDLRERLGPRLCVLSGIDPAWNQAEIRARLIVFLAELADRLPEDLGLALSVALALDEDVRHRFLDERMECLAAMLHRDARTARRRVDEAISLAESFLGPPSPDTGDYRLGAWHLARFRALLSLEGHPPRGREERPGPPARSRVPSRSARSSRPAMASRKS